MKTLTNFKVLAIFMMSFLLLTAISNAADTDKTKEVKIKTSVSGTDGKEKVETIIYLLKGVKEAAHELENKVLTVKYESDQISPFMLVYTLENLGYSAEVIEDNFVSNEEKSEDDFSTK